MRTLVKNGLKRQGKLADFNSIHANMKTVDIKESTNGNLQERIKNLIFDGQVKNKTNQKKDCYWLNVDLVDKQLSTFYQCTQYAYCYPYQPVTFTRKSYRINCQCTNTGL